jgi:hypothetical protein
MGVLFLTSKVKFYKKKGEGSGTGSPYKVFPPLKVLMILMGEKSMTWASLHFPQRNPFQPFFSLDKDFNLFLVYLFFYYSSQSRDSNPIFTQSRYPGIPEAPFLKLGKSMELKNEIKSLLKLRVKYRDLFNFYRL